MKSKKLMPNGAAIINLETDFDKAQPFDESKLTPTQAQVFSQLSPRE